jgi:protein-S-isoprenylcysteine O-methyltransferase Ste14
VLAVILTRRFILPEEDRLRAGFGPEFAQWASRTRRWL